MTIRYTKDGFIKTTYEIREEYPNMSIPLNANLRSIGYEYLKETEAPKQAGYIAIENGALDNTLQWILDKIPVPTEISMRQCRLQLLHINLLDEVDTIVNGSKVHQIEWEYAQSVERASPLVLLLQDMLNLTDEYINDLFIEASKL